MKTRYLFVALLVLIPFAGILLFVPGPTWDAATVQAGEVLIPFAGILLFVLYTSDDEEYISGRKS